LREATRGRSLPIALVVAMRPRQWLKNVLVFAAPVANGSLFVPAILLASIGAFVAFCLMASATYLVNDLLDVEADRAHPTKRNRPIAARELSPTLAIVEAAVLGVAALVLALWISPSLLWVLVAYAALTLSYSVYLKREPVIELVLVAVGFLLRAIAGGAASGIPISNWFLIVAFFGSLFMAAGKRYSEMERMSRANGVDEGLPSTRRSLDGYTRGYLRFVWAIAASVTVTAYCLWAFEVGEAPSTAPWAIFSVLPFVIAILRYAVDIDRGTAEAPEEVVLGDPALIVVGFAWLALFGLAALGV
jgi:decaprenyl-phosphate phosphoribosyltransferase